jgi:hypothetical protein
LGHERGATRLASCHGSHDSRIYAVLAVLAVTIAALSLGPSFAHVLESIPRLKQWSPELWRETTVFNAQSWLLRYDRLPLRFALAAA